MQNYQDRFIYFLVLATLSGWLGFALRKKILEISDPENGFLAEPSKLIKHIGAPLGVLLNRVLIPGHFVLLGISLGKTGEADQGFQAMLLLGVGFAFAVFVTVFLFQRFVRPLAARAGIAEAYPAAYVVVASFGGGNRGFVILYLLSMSPLFAHLIGDDSVILVNRYIAFDAGYYFVFLLFFILWIRPRMFGIKSDSESFLKGDLLDFLPPNLVIAAAFLGPVIKAAGFNPSIPDEIIFTLRTTVGNVIFFLATIYMIFGLPTKALEKIQPMDWISGALAVLVPRAAAVALVVFVFTTILHSYSFPPLLLQHGLVVGCIFCLLPASSIISSMLDAGSGSEIRDRSVATWIVHTNLYFLIYLSVTVLLAGFGTLI
jgi:hypothetical protein